MNRIRQQGLTLIEVLIALAIIAIAITAVMKAVSQNITGTQYLRDKTIAIWVGKEALNAARVGTLPVSSDKAVQQIKLLDRIWYVELYEKATPNKRIKRIIANVYGKDPDQGGISPLVSFETYRYESDKT